MAIETVQVSTDPAVAKSQQILQQLFAGYGRYDFAVRFWDGTVWQPEPAAPVKFTFVLKHRGAVRRMFWPPSPVSFGCAYIYDDFDIEGDVQSFCVFGRHLEAAPTRLSVLQRLKIGLQIFTLPQVEQRREGRGPAELSGQMHSRERDRKAISYHYDTSNEFFQKILGPTMVYTSGIWEEGDDLDAAQRRKLDLLYTKLRLKPGERLLDIGCGWGVPAIHAAREFGAQSLGVTLSEKQADWARRFVREAGVEDRCRIEVRDYRDLNEPGSFDKIVMMEVGEHFGYAEFEGYFRKCFELLKPGGQLMIQQIQLFGAGRKARAVREFGLKFVFPDGELVPVSWMVKNAELAGFDVRDVESVREHYPKTLQCWLNNLEANHDELVALTDEATYRTFRLYLAGARYGYLTNLYQLHHMLFVKPDATGGSPVPTSRRDWYEQR